MIMMASMLVGVVGAVVPMIGRHTDGHRIRVAHAGMLAVMTAMVLCGMQTWLAVVSSITLVALALYVTTELSDRSRGIPCAVDLTAMAVLFMLVPTGGGHASMSGTMSMPQPMHHGSAIDPRLFALVVLGCWVTTTVVISRKNSLGKRAAIGSALMVLGMTPIAL
ncbi:hypothetical protein [Rhodococcoides fascians]|uniref:hypothetical protein n=1 Tax=Rhodococcoides fascians TaxID=1828 RepID=UPI000565EEBB|nr:MULTISPECIES: hypothetical protein [Rhodococcus]OZF00504.1 hypothetical protein CH301_12520 [Rhodococcus sp. 15-1189-1-1a]